MCESEGIFKIVVLLIGILLCSHLFAQEWDIPTDEKAKKSYLKFTDEIAKEGEELYILNCQSCHGNPGKGNYLKTLKPTPPDMVNPVTQGRSDGDLFYILTEGRLLMPAFKDILSEKERWKVISYIRSFNEDYVQIVSKIDTLRSKLVKINLEFDTAAKLLIAEIKATEKTDTVPLKYNEVTLFVERYFGELQIDSIRKTDNEGVAKFYVPSDLPGDKIGNVGLIVKVSSEFYGEVESRSKIKIGVPTDKPSLTDDRAVWNVLKKAPLWIILTFSVIVLLVASTLFYIILSLMKLKRYAKE